MHIGVVRRQEDRRRTRPQRYRHAQAASTLARTHTHTPTHTHTHTHTHTGLRPARFLTTTDGLVCMMSETGVVPGLDEAKIDEKGRLGPGQIIALDLETGEFDENYDVKSKIAKKYPYGQW